MPQPVSILAAGFGRRLMARFCTHKSVVSGSVDISEFYRSLMRIAVDFSVMKLPVSYTMSYFNVIFIF
jgi:hypothetical protein